jgi:ABC-type transport system substrate-binding protein
MIAKILTILFGLTLVLIVACGSSPAAPEPTVAPAEPTAAPAGSETSQPTATPQMAAPPAEVEVNPGKLTIMVGDLANERFDNVFVGGTPGLKNYSQLVHGFLIDSNEKRELVPGIASQWGLSPDGLTWTFTIRKTLYVNTR